LSPSGASALIDDVIVQTVSKASPVLGPVEEPSFAIERGLAIHKLLQVLPDLPPEARRVAAGRYMLRVGSAWEEAERDRAVESVFALLEDARFAPIFAETSRAEVSVMGHLPVLGAERAVSGTIDRLAVTSDEVLIVDYKTNRPPPQGLPEVPEAYVLQLALYRALLQPLYPDRTVSAGLLFTESPRLMAVPAEAMDAALARLT
jgi:ATP-dependent helicase/nuclease subunit A